jgi:hypothetical protein
MYSSTLSLTSALDGVGGQRHALVTLPPGKTRYPLYRRLGENMFIKHVIEFKKKSFNTRYVDDILVI